MILLISLLYRSKPITDIASCHQILSLLPSSDALQSEGVSIQKVVWDLTNRAHVQWVTIASNLRARNFHIPEDDWLKTMHIAGNLFPRLITTTSVVSGLCCLEVYKILSGSRSLSSYLDTFCHLATNTVISLNPSPPKFFPMSTKGKEWKWTCWDTITIPSSVITVQELIDWLQEEYGWELIVLSTGVWILYADVMKPDKVKLRKEMKLYDVIEMVTQKPIPSTDRWILLDVLVENPETNEEVECPSFRYCIDTSDIHN